MRELVLQSQNNTENLLRLREGIINEGVRLSNEMENDHNRLLSYAQQSAAVKARATFIERQLLDANDALGSTTNTAATSSSENVNTNTTVVRYEAPRALLPKYLFDCVRPLAPRPPPPSDRANKVSEAMQARELRTTRRAEKEEVKSIDKKKVATLSVMSEMDNFLALQAAPMYQDCPQDLINELIVWISENTNIGSGARGKARRNVIVFLNELGYDGMSEGSWKRYVKNYEKDSGGTFPNRTLGRPEFCPPKVLALVLKEIGDLSRTSYAPNLNKIRDLLYKYRAQHANSQGRGDLVPSAATENRCINVLRSETVSTFKSDNVTGSRARHLAGCYRPNLANLLLYYRLSIKPSGEFLRRGFIWNLDAFGLSVKKGADDSFETFVEYRNRGNQIFGESAKYGSNGVLRGDPFVLANNAGLCTIAIPVKLGDADTIFDEGKEIYDLRIPLGNGTEVYFVFYKGKGKDKDDKNRKTNLCLHLIDNLILPTMRKNLKQHGWDGNMDTITDEKFMQAITIDGEGAMLGAFKQRTFDGTMARFNIRGGKTSPKTTGQAKSGQPLDRLETGFMAMHAKLKKWLKVFDDEERWKRLVKTATEQGKTPPVRKNKRMFKDIEEWPIFSELQRQVAGGQAAALGINFTKWRELAIMGSIVMSSFASCFAQYDVIKCFQTFTDIGKDLEDTLQNALSFNPGYNYDLNHEERAKVLAPDTIELYKQHIKKDPGMNDDIFDTLGLPKGRNPKRKTSQTGDQQKMAFEFTSEAHLQNVKEADQLKQKDIDDKAKEKQDKEQKRAQAAKEKLEKAQLREEKKKKAAEVRKMKLLEVKSKGKDLVEGIVQGTTDFTIGARSKLSTQKWKAMAIYLCLDKRYYQGVDKQALEKEVTTMLYLLASQDGHDIFDEYASSDDASSDEDEDEDGDSPMNTSSSSSSSSAPPLLASVNATVVLIIHGRYVDDISYAQHSLIRFDEDSDFYWRAVVDNPGEDWNSNWQLTQQAIPASYPVHQLNSTLSGDWGQDYPAEAIESSVVERGSASNYEGEHDSTETIKSSGVEGENDESDSHLPNQNEQYHDIKCQRCKLLRRIPVSKWNRIEDIDDWYCVFHEGDESFGDDCFECGVVDQVERSRKRRRT
jgi:hypothetical protein